MRIRKAKLLYSLVVSFLVSVAGPRLYANSNIGPNDHSLKFSGYKKDVDLGKLGVLSLQADSRVKTPKMMEGGDLVGDGVVAAEVGITHTLKNGYVIYPLSVKAKGTSVQIDSLRAGDNELGEFSLDVSGLLMIGTADFIMNSRAAQDLRTQGVELKSYDDDQSRTTLTKRLSITLNDQDAATLSRQRSQMLTDAKTLKGYEQIGGSVDQNVLLMLKKQYGDSLAIYHSTLKRLAKFEYACMPTFTRTVRFPIWEIGNTAASEGGSASAAIGVSGDIVVSVKPKCGVSFGSLNTADIYVTADIQVQSHGYLGASAEGHGTSSLNMGISFDSEEYGHYVSPQLFLDQKQKEVLSNIVLSSLEIVRGSAAFSDNVFRTLVQSGLVGQLQSRLMAIMIGTPSSPATIDRICNIIKTIGALPGSDGDLVCQMAGQSLPTAPALKLAPFVAPPMPAFPVRPNLACLAALPAPNCRFANCSDNDFAHTVDHIVDRSCKVRGKVASTCQKSIDYGCSEVLKVPGFCGRPRRPCMKDTVLTKTCKRMENYSCMVDGMVDSTCQDHVPQRVIDYAAQASCNAANAACTSAIDGVDTTNRARGAACEQLASWQKEVERVSAAYNRDVLTPAKAAYDHGAAQAQADFDKAMADFKAKVTKITKYQSPSVIYQAAAQLIVDKVFTKNQEEAFAKRLLAAAWKINDQGQYFSGREGIASALMNDGFAASFGLSATGSSRLAFESTLHILEVKPELAIRTLFGRDATTNNPVFNEVATFSWHHDPSSKGRMGGIDLAGLTLKVALSAAILNQKIDLNLDQTAFAPVAIGGEMISSQVDWHDRLDLSSMFDSN